MLDILNSRVCLDVAVDFIGKSRPVKNVENLLCDIEFDEIRIGTYESFSETAALCLVCDFLYRTAAVVACFIKIESVSHFHSPQP